MNTKQQKEFNRINEYITFKWFEAQNCGYSDGTNWYPIGKYNTCDEANSAAAKYRNIHGIPVRVVEVERTEIVIWEDEINEN